MKNNKTFKVCILGCGTYGSYLAKRLIENFNNKIQITIIEIGDDKTKNEKEIGIVSKSENSSAAINGRYFGLGGTSARWGGQILFFDERDNPKNQPVWNKIVQINHQYGTKVLKKLMGDSIKSEQILNDKNDIKTGIWLKYSKRNIFKLLDKKSLSAIEIIKNHRVTDFIFKRSKISAVVCQRTIEERKTPKTDKEVIKTIEADFFYLTAGAIESCRLLLAINTKNNIIPSKDLGKNYGDHLSVELFKINGHPPIINGKNLLPTFMKGSLVTKRLVVHTKDGLVGFAHPVFNKEVKVFSSIKQMLFGKQKISFNIKDTFTGLEFLARFGFNMLFLKKMYAHRNNWSIQLDIEQEFPNDNNIQLSDTLDQFGQNAAQLNWNVNPKDKQSIIEIKTELEALLKKEGIDYTTVFDPEINSTKIEDVYHPVGFIRMGQDENAVLDYNCKVKGIDNLYHFSTAMFPSAKSINPTGAGFCFIEHHINTVFPHS